MTRRHIRVRPLPHASLRNRLQVLCKVAPTPDFAIVAALRSRAPLSRRCFAPRVLDGGLAMSHNADARRRSERFFELFECRRTSVQKVCHESRHAVQAARCG